MNNKKKSGLILGVLIIIAGVLYITVQASTKTGVLYPLDSSYPEKGEYEIDPRTILEAIDQGKIDVFESAIATSNTDSNPPLSTGIFPWNQSDYMKVANALHQYVWKENLNNWHLYSMYFYKDCQDNLAGFDSGKITFFKASNGLFSNTTHLMDIYPVGHGVSWGGKANFPRPISGWESIELNKIKLTADDALRMAEEKGGQEFRLKVKNACSIDVFINPNPNQDDDWIVYYDNKGLSTFELHVDPYTGEYKIKNSSK